jgi:hypothetical protein
MQSCSLSGNIPQEGVGIGTPISSLPGCNPLWSASVPKGNCSSTPNPQIGSPNVLFNFNQNNDVNAQPSSNLPIYTGFNPAPTAAAASTNPAVATTASTITTIYSTTTSQKSTTTTATSTTTNPLNPTTVCVGGTGSGNYIGLCSFCCSYGYCPTGPCACTSSGSPVPTPPTTGVNGVPLPGEDSSYLGLCSFACNHGYCPPTACTTS